MGRPRKYFWLHVDLMEEEVFREISPAEFKLLAYLVFHSDSFGLSSQGEARMAEACGWSEKHSGRLVRKLIRRGMLTVAKSNTGRGHANDLKVWWTRPKGT